MELRGEVSGGDEVAWRQSEISQSTSTEYLLRAQQSQTEHNKGHKNTKDDLSFNKWCG